MAYPRDLRGYGPNPPDPRWPGSARVAVQFVLNIEEGAESSIVNGDSVSEAYLHELWGRPPRQGQRDPSVESMYEYGSRVGAWRILELFRSRRVPLTAFATGKALELNPELATTLAEDNHEIAGHGYRWLDYASIGEDEERRHIDLTVKAIEKLTGKTPVGWYTGRVSCNTRHLVAERRELTYTADAYNDDLPYRCPEHPHLLVIPYTLVNNDFRYLLPNGFSCGEAFFNHLRDAFDLLWQEGERHPKMMSVGLHGRISGHPARAMALARFLDHVQNRDQIWICRRSDIAEHWTANHPSPED